MEKLEPVGTTPSHVAVSSRADAHRSGSDNPKSGRSARHGVSTTGCSSIVDLFPDTLDLGTNPISPFLGQYGSIRFRVPLHCQRVVAARSWWSRIFSNSHAAPVPAPAPITDPIAAHNTHHLPPSGLETSRMIAAVTKPVIVPGPTFFWRLPGMTPATSPASAAPMMPTPSHTRSSID